MLKKHILISAANTHHDATIFEKNRIPQESKTVFPGKEKTLKLFIKKYIFRSYLFLMKVTFSEMFKNTYL